MKSMDKVIAERGKEFMGRILEIQRAKGKATPQDNGKENVNGSKSNTLFIGSLNFKTTESTLRSVFEKYGTVTEIRIAKDKHTHRPKGFAHLEYATFDETKKAAAALNGHEVDGRNIKVDISVPRPIDANRGEIKARGDSKVVRGGSRGGKIK
jgi:nucleolin